MIPFVSSNLCAARIRPRLPSLIRSESDTPWFWYFFATETTKRRLERTSLSSASWSPSRMLLREPHFFFARDQRIRADVAQVLIERAFVVRRLLVAGTRPCSSAAARVDADRGHTSATASRRRAQWTRSPNRCHRMRVSHAKCAPESGSIAVVDDERPPAHQRVGDEAPVAAVERVVAVVAEHEVVLSGDDQRTPVVSGRMIARWPPGAVRTR